MAVGKTHFPRPPTAAELRAALASNPPGIFLSKSSFSRMSSRARSLLDSTDVEVVIGSSRGRPIEVDMQKLSQVVELHRDNRTYREIEEATGVPKSTAHYLIKYAGRQKLRSGKKVVYL